MSKGRWMTAIGTALVLGLLVAAWIDGGRQPLRVIEEPVATPEGVR